jgi:hypothetical protein
MEDVQGVLLYWCGARCVVGSLVFGHERPLMRNRKTDIKRIVARTRRPNVEHSSLEGEDTVYTSRTRGRVENVRRCVEVA